MASVDWKKLHDVSYIEAVCNHIYRKTDYYSNKDINLENSCLNYSYTFGDCDGSFSAFCDRLNSVEENMVSNGYKLRSDAVRALSLSVPLPSALSDDLSSEEDFFKFAFYLSGRLFGKENVVFGVVHKDEIHEYTSVITGENCVSCPHMHILVVPEKNGRLCAKELMTKKNMQWFNSELDSYCCLKYGFHYMTGEKRKGKSVDVLKSDFRDIQRPRTRDRLGTVH